MSDDPTSLGDFSGRARLFPLPNLVLFPSVVQPLHIFEPRYRQLMEDALKDDRLIAMALLQPGWEDDYYKNPPIYPVVCLGRVHKEERLPDGRWNLLLHGLARARVEIGVDDGSALSRGPRPADVRGGGVAADGRGAARPTRPAGESLVRGP